MIAGWDKLASSAGPPSGNVENSGVPARRSARKDLLETEISNLKNGCHGPGVCDKAVSSIDVENE